MDSTLNRILFLDLESTVDKRIHGLGALLSDRKPLRARNAQSVLDALPTLLNWAANADYICGHNALIHDFPLLANTPFGNVPQDKALDTLLLSPLAFPKKPYHALIKAGKLATTSKNDPVADSLCCREVLKESLAELAQTNPNDLDLYITAFTAAGLHGIAKLIHKSCLHQPLPINQTPQSRDDHASQFLHTFARLNASRCCLNKLPKIREADDFLAYTYIHSWLNVAGADSVLPYWLCHRFPQIRSYLHTLRTVHCGDAACPYCSQMHSATKALQRYFQFNSFRPTPCVPGAPDKSLQEHIVSSAIQGHSSLSILPTGGGKSICFQIPALHRYECTGALSIIISPLQSLMKDQVENLRSRVGILHCNALYGLLTPLERKACLQDIALGSVGLIYVAPEQLRSTAFRNAIRNREIAFWIYDEAHCLSKWGHDFRPDYLYAATFIRELAQEQGLDCPQIMALTATAKSDVRNDIQSHFQNELEIEIHINDGGTERANLNYTVEQVSPSAKLERIVEILTSYYGDPPNTTGKGSVVIFCATQRGTQEYAESLCHKGWNAKHYHAGIEVEEKKRILDEFLAGTIKIIVSTNAFGMGVDKPDIRYVIHVDAPGSLENYLQEAGRAGRDGGEAECILLFNENDLETQHNFVALSKITKKDIQIIWKAIRSAKSDENGAITLTVDEILSDKTTANISFDGEYGSNRKTKTQTAIALLERQGFLERKENRSRVFQARALVSNLEEAREKTHALKLPIDQIKLWTAVMEQFFEMPENTCSELSQFSQLEEMQAEFQRQKERDPRILSINTVVFKVLNAMSAPGTELLKKDLLFTAFLKSGKNNSTKTLQLLSELEHDFIKLLQVEEPTPEGTCPLRLRPINEALCRSGLASHVDTLGRTLKFLRDDWAKFSSGVPGLEVNQHSPDNFTLKLRSGWDDILRFSSIRRELAALILDCLQAKPIENKSELISFSESDLIQHITDDLSGIASEVESLPQAIHHTLLWLHEGKVIELQQGKSLITTAMTLYLKDHIKGRRARAFTKGDYAPLAIHYVEKILQVHIIGEYSKKAIREIGTHLHFIKEYFRLEGNQFIKKFFSGKEEYLTYATGIESYRKIYESLGNPKQQAIVATQKQNNLLVLAGPGSGKTRVIVHRCAWLLRVDRVRARGIIILCFNRFAALDIRRRLWKLIGQDAAAVTIQTFHGLALRILGRSLADLDLNGGQGKLTFEQLIPEAIKMLKSEEVPIGMDADEFRERLVGSLSHILVDEYQDIGPEAYELVSLIAGKSREAEEDKLNIMAVGDDDQSIYAFAGANVEFIRRYERDYGNQHINNTTEKQFIQRHYLVENYRSSQHIIAASNRLIRHNRDRMKIDYPIEINHARNRDPKGGQLEALDPIAQGHVQILNVEDRINQAEACLAEILRLKSIEPANDWNQFCVFARTNQELTLLRLVFEKAQIPLTILGEQTMPNLRRIRSIYHWLNYLETQKNEFWTGDILLEQLANYLEQFQTRDQHDALLDHVARVWYGETGGIEQRVSDIAFFFHETLAEKDRSASHDGVRLATAHKAKGLEFDHVLILDGPWYHKNKSRHELEEDRRTFYVAMTRAKNSLALFRLQSTENQFIDEIIGPETKERSVPTDHSSADLVNTRCSLLNLDELWIDFAATRRNSDPCLKAIDDLKSNDLLHFYAYTTPDQETRIDLKNANNITVACLSRKGVESWINKIDTIQKITLIGIHMRKSTDGEQAPNKTPPLQIEWGIPICEIYHCPPN